MVPIRNKTILYITGFQNPEIMKKKSPEEETKSQNQRTKKVRIVYLLKQPSSKNSSIVSKERLKHHLIKLERT